NVAGARATSRSLVVTRPLLRRQEIVRGDAGALVEGELALAGKLVLRGTTLVVHCERARRVGLASASLQVCLVATARVRRILAGRLAGRERGGVGLRRPVKCRGA